MLSTDFNKRLQNEGKRITIFAGHYGSGKTTAALNYALWLKKNYENTVICDLDIVNPYFRTGDHVDFMADKGITIISPTYANTNVEAPSIPAGAQAVFDDKSLRAVIDLGGDDAGSAALGRYSEAINNENDYEMLMVINKYRPLTGDIESLVEIKDEIEKASKVRFTAIVNNSNLGRETTVEDILKSEEFAREAGRVLSLPVKMTTLNRDLIKNLKIGIDDTFPLMMFDKPIWKIRWN